MFKNNMMRQRPCHTGAIFLDPRDLQNYIVPYRDYIIQYAHKKPKKNIPLLKWLQSAWRYYCFPCAQNHAPVTKIPSRQTNATDRVSRAHRTTPIPKRFLLPNITYMLIIDPGPVARTDMLSIHILLAHDVVLNHIFKLLINTTMLFWYIWNEHFNK